MRYIYTILTAAMCALLCCCNTTTNSTLFDEGVSFELAQHRKESIKNLRYNLHFDIPEDINSSVTGTSEIIFTLDTPHTVIVDFRSDASAISAVKVNGKSAEYEFRNEHIILDKQLLNVGSNSVKIDFTATDQSLNRNDEFLYTLLVPDRARTLFPCFEQPNLKAEFTLSLTLPDEWCAVSNTSPRSEHIADGRKVVTFNPTEPLSTYLFSFVAGKLQSQSYDDGRHTFTAYYRETDPKRVAQLDTIFKQVASSLDWLEHYTDIAYPFAKYDIVILPGFQYGGMEHTGATLYNDTQMFLSEHPTPDEELRRIQLIAHETAHMWFGDYVTMAWFDDVWTKEVFANYFAARIAEPLFPDINHTLNWLKTTVAASLAEDRTAGSTAIKQPLDNLRNAGLVYGNIIYNKAPVMMRKMVEIMGEEPFRDGIREYLRTYAYGNATWDELIAILDSYCDEDLAAFSDVWVNQHGMPHIELKRDGNRLTVTQSDPYGRGLKWAQQFNLTLVGDSNTSIEVDMSKATLCIELPENVRYILPNTDGRGYGLFIMDAASREWLLHELDSIADDTARQSLLMALYEEYQHGIIGNRDFVDMVLRSLPAEQNALIASTMCSYLREPLHALHDREIEEQLLRLAESHPITSCRQQLLRTLIGVASSQEVCAALYDIWQSGEHTLLSENDYMTMAYELAVRYPERYDAIVTKQRARLRNPDRQRQFEFISGATTPNIEQRDSVFEALLDAKNRVTEPWAASALGYLNHPLRSDEAVKYIRPALDILTEIQLTGDIFFPRNWVGALLGGHRSSEANACVEQFFSDNPNYSQLLKNKILQASWALQRAQDIGDSSICEECNSEKTADN